MKPKLAELKVIAITDHYNYQDISTGYFPLIKEEGENQEIIVLNQFYYWFFKYL